MRRKRKEAPKPSKFKPLAPGPKLVPGPPKIKGPEIRGPKIKGPEIPRKLKPTEVWKSLPIKHKILSVTGAAIIVVIATFLIYWIFTGGLPSISEQPEEVSPSVKIESVTAKFKEWVRPYEPYYETIEGCKCIVEASGTATLPVYDETGAYFSFPGGDATCANWDLTTTPAHASNMCVRHRGQPATTKWSLTREVYFVLGEEMRFDVWLTSVIDIDGYSWNDSVTLTCC